MTFILTTKKSIITLGAVARWSVNRCCTNNQSLIPPHIYIVRIFRGEVLVYTYNLIGVPTSQTECRKSMDLTKQPHTNKERKYTTDAANTRSLLGMLRLSRSTKVGSARRLHNKRKYLYMEI